MIRLSNGDSNVVRGFHPRDSIRSTSARSSAWNVPGSRPCSVAILDADGHDLSLFLHGRQRRGQIHVLPPYEVLTDIGGRSHSKRAQRDLRRPTDDRGLTHLRRWRPCGQPSLREIPKLLTTT